MVLLGITIALATAILKLRKSWHDGSKSKMEAELLRLEHRRKRRGG